jgi:hypothetical protein
VEASSVGRAARHAGEAAKAQKKVHDAETKLRAEEQREARKAEENRRAAEKKATIERERADSRRESVHREEVATLHPQIDDRTTAGHSTVGSDSRDHHGVVCSIQP